MSFPPHKITSLQSLERFKLSGEEIFWRNYWYRIYIKSYFAYEFYIKKTYKLIYYSSANVTEFVEIETDYQDFIQSAIHSE